MRGGKFRSLLGPQPGDTGRCLFVRALCSFIRGLVSSPGISNPRSMIFKITDLG